MTPSQIRKPDAYNIPQTVVDVSGHPPAANNRAPDETAYGVAPGSALSRLLSFRAENVSYLSTTDVAKAKREITDQDSTANTKRRKNGNFPSLHAHPADDRSSRSVDGTTIAVTPREYQRASCDAPTSATSKNALKPLIKEILPRGQPGLFPDDVSEELKIRYSDRMRHQSIENVRAKVRIALKEMHDVEEVGRVPATGTKGGASFRYTLPGSGRAVQSPCPERPCAPITPSQADTDLDASPWRSQKDDMQSKPGGETTLQQERSDSNEQDTQVMEEDPVGQQPFVVPSDEHDLTRVFEERSAEDPSQRQDTDSQKTLVQLGQQVCRMRILKTELTESMRKVTECKAQQERGREIYTALEREAQENKARAVDLEAEAQNLQERLSLVKIRVADHKSKAHRLDAEAVEKKEACLQSEITVAEVNERCSDLDRELSAIKEALDIDWIFS